MPLRRPLLAAVLLLSVATPALADDRDELVAAFSKAFAKGSFRAEMHTVVGGKPMRVRTDVQWPDRFHMTMPEMEVIILPQGTWMNAAGVGQWMPVPMDMSEMIKGYSKQGMDAGLASLKDVTKSGSAEVAGCSSTLYRYRNAGEFMGVTHDAQAEAAVCDATGLPVRVVTEGEQTVTVLYDFETAIDIRPPG
jgi:hypothetical protein